MEINKQSVGNSSVAVIAGQDLTVTNNYGLTVAEVKELCYLFLKENFPQLRAEAAKTAKENIDNYLKILDEKIKEQIHLINYERLKDPDIQSSLNDTVISSAKKGSKAHFDLLSDLIIQRLSNETTDFISLVASEALIVIPKLNRNHINYLTLAHFLKYMKFSPMQNLEEYEEIAKAIYELTKDSFNISTSQILHLQYTGCASHLSIIGNNIYEIWKNNYEFLKPIAPNVLTEIIKEKHKYLYELATAFSTAQIGSVSLTSVGQLIALVNLKPILGNINYSIWLK